MSQQIQDYARSSTGPSYSLINVNTKANIALKAVGQLASLLNVEYKKVDVAMSLTPDTTGAVQHISGITQGDGASNRDGNQVKMKSLQVRATIARHASATGTFVRLAIVKDTDNQGADPTCADILESVAVTAFTSYNNRRRFIIIKEWIIDLGDRTTATIEWYKKLTMKLNFSDTAATDTTDNHLYLMHLSNEATNKPTVIIKTRIRYLDN